MGYIPWTSIDRFAFRYRIEGEAFDRLEQMIRFIETQDKRITDSQQKKAPAK